MGDNSGEAEEIGDSVGDVQGDADTPDPPACNATVCLIAMGIAVLIVGLIAIFFGPSQPGVNYSEEEREPAGRAEQGYAGGSGPLLLDEKTTSALRLDDESEPVGTSGSHPPVKRRHTAERKGETERTIDEDIPSHGHTTVAVTTTRRTASVPTTATREAATARTTPTVVPLRTVAPRALLCTVGRYARADTKYPEDGLCDFLFCPAGLQANLQFTSFGDAFPAFREHAATARNTKHGIDIRISEIDTTLARLETSQGAAAFRDQWESNVQQHGVLHTVLHDGVNFSYVDMITGLLNTLRRLQKKHKDKDPSLPSYLFVGTAVVLHGNVESKIVKGSFTRIIKEVKPDVIILRTHYAEKDDGNHNCRVTGPAIWQGHFSSQQPTFLDSLRFIQTTKVPQSTAIFLSFTEAVRWYRWDFADESSFTLGEKCVTDFHPYLISRSTLCSDTADKGQDAAVKHKVTQQMCLVQKRGSNGLVYDNHDTMRTKMCWTGTTFGNTFGWAMFDLEFADTDNACKDPAFIAGFALLRWMKHYMATRFNDPSECGVS